MNTVYTKIVCISLLGLFFVTLSSEAQIKNSIGKYKYTKFIISVDVNLIGEKDVKERLHELGDDPLVDMDKFERALLLYRLARIKKEEKGFKEAFGYFDEIYQNIETLKNPIVLTWMGTVEANWGGAIKKPLPARKMQLLQQGIDKIDSAIRVLSKNEKENYFGLGYVYFLRGTTLANAPEFLEITQESKKDLKTALYYFKKAKLTKQYGDLIASVYMSYSRYYLVRGKISVANKNLEAALKLAFSSQMKDYIKEKIKAVKGG